MGEISRHADVFKHTYSQIKNLRDEDFVCIEYGNFIADLTNFRDPFACIGSKKMIWQKAKEKVIIGYIPVLGILLGDPILDILDVEKWLNKLMGEAEGDEPRFGKLIQFFEHISLGVSHLVFANDIVNKQFRRGLPESLRLESYDVGLITPAEVERIFRKSYIQYYPNEHFDYPPHRSSRENRKNYRDYRRGARGLVGFLESYIDYLTEEFTKLEMEWKQKKNLSREHPDRHDILVQLGKLLHGIEDYFFHSNYCEVLLWKKLKESRTSTENIDTYRVWFSRNALRRYSTYTGYNINDYDSPTPSIKNNRARKLMRRLRDPIYNGNDADNSDSNDATDLIFTGSFESKDIYHTMLHALENLESLLSGLDTRANTLVNNPNTQPLNPSRVLKESTLVLIKALFNEDQRKRYVQDSDVLEEDQKKHVEQLKDKKYQNGIQRLFDNQLINESAKNALIRAFDLDWAFESEEFGPFNMDLPGVGGFLLQFLTIGQEEIDKSNRVSNRLNSKDIGKANQGDILNQATDNQASSELVGTHTLMSKDTPASQPLYEDALTLSKFASSSVARILIDEINSSNDTTTGLDWKAIIQHYIRFPNSSNQRWESLVLANYREKGTVVATYDEITDKPNLAYLRLAPANPLLMERRQGAKRHEWEQKYIEMEKIVDRYFFNIIPG